MRNQEIIDLTDRFHFPTYARYPLALAKGRGIYVWTAEGKRFIDCVGALGAAGLGHCHPAVARAVAKQARKLVHTTNIFYNEPQAKLAERLTRLARMEKAFFCNSGAEANESAFKLARKHAISLRGPDAYEIVSVSGSFHGRTLACIAASGQERLKKGFGPPLPGFITVAWGDLKAMEAVLGPRSAAVIIEPILGEGGVLIPPPSYLQGIRRVCDERGISLIFDEVQVGLGRTGRLCAFDHFGVLPDIVTLAKAIAGGLPMGVMLARGPVAGAFGPGDHASTFGGNPLVAAAARATLDALEKEGLVENAAREGAYFLEGLQNLKKIHPAVVDVRGMGLILALELDRPARPVALKCLEKGLLVGLAQERNLRFLPPLAIRKKEIDRVLKILAEVLP